MDVTRQLRLLAASLMMLTGIIHLALTDPLTTDVVALTWMAVMALFGLLYVAIGIGLLASKQISFYLGAIIPLVGACVAAYHYVVVKPELVLLVFMMDPLIVIDIIVILCCCYIILHKTPSRPPELSKH